MESVISVSGLRKSFGAAEAVKDVTFRVEEGAAYASPGTIHVEGDASAASYFLAAGAIGGGPVRVTGVGRGSIQGDVAVAAESASSLRAAGGHPGAAARRSRVCEQATEASALSPSTACRSQKSAAGAA